MFTQWQAPAPGGGDSMEMALVLDRSRAGRLLVIPPFFDEHNKFRRQAVEIMRALDLAGIDTFLPDLPGTNESRSNLEAQTLSDWRIAARSAATRFRATHAFAIRSGALLLPDGIPAIAYAPQKGSQLLRGLVRARTIAAREAGREEKAPDIMDIARERGIELSGWHLGPTMVRELEHADYQRGSEDRVIEQAEVGGTPLWLRAEPDEDPAQAAALAGNLATAIGSDK
ncbi:hypothetical protein [Qipengyuania sp. MTN3-11]|uniref:hypothetical protein n=1 Tax=Qipengyuania sp. MTN3-11 TaxID=3056557 RepID=UPI0036F3A027